MATQKFTPGQTVYRVSKGYRGGPANYDERQVLESRMVDRTRFTVGGTKTIQVEEIRLQGDYKFRQPGTNWVLNEAQYLAIKPQVDEQKAAAEVAKARETARRNGYVSAALQRILKSDDMVAMAQRFFALGYDWASTCMTCGGRRYSCSCEGGKATTIDDLLKMETSA